MRALAQKKVFVPFLVLALVAAAVLGGLIGDAKGLKPQKLSEAQKAYLMSVYNETWNYLAAFVEPETGLPFDSDAKQPATSMSNVGLYLTSAAIAYRTGLISAEEGQGRVEKALASLEKIETWHGFPRPWVLVRSLKPTFGEEFSYGSHLANLIGGLTVASTTFPETAARIQRFLSTMEFRSLYDAKSGWLRGGYNVKTKDFAIFQPWGPWYYKFFASETRLLSFYLIARKAAPKEHWAGLIRPVQEIEGEKYFTEGYEPGGLFTQYSAGLFLDERNTEMGESQRAYARSQMKHAKKIGAPVWGWSVSEDSHGRYLAAGELRDEIVAPYASVLAVIYFPVEVTDNLKELEKLGARPRLADDGQTRAFGFKDSLNWKTRAVSKHTLTPSQAMAFLSLANALFDGVVWRSFAEDPIVQRGLRILEWKHTKPRSFYTL